MEPIKGLIDLYARAGRATDERASDLIIRVAKEKSGRAHALSVESIANLALALAKAPEIARLVRKAVIMGSAIFHPGVQGPTAPMVDANFANSPEAARIVLTLRGFIAIRAPPPGGAGRRRGPLRPGAK
jgi:purine nucleosidase